jgi:RNA polymerase sigma-70 factor (ECF subfamily)
LIRLFAQEAGLTADEAEEVVQETAIGLARSLPNFRYDPEKCRFKTWLLNLTRWRIQNQLRKRGQGHRLDYDPLANPEAKQGGSSSDSERTATVERVPDPSLPEFGAEWDSMWEQNLLAAAMENVRPRLGERQFQAFDLYVTKGWSPGDVANTLGISRARVYLIKHRVSRLLKGELQRIEHIAEQSLRTRK